jgi:hypothetical protein
MRHGRHIGLVTVGLVLAVASPAFAGTVSVSGRTLHYTTASTGPDGLWVMVDGGIGIVGDNTLGVVAGPGCAQEGLDARCLGVDDAVIELGSGGSSVDVSSLSTSPIRVVGGAGSDRVTSDGGQLDFDGGPGGDLLVFSAYGGASADSFSGGPGRDFVYYTSAQRTAEHQPRRRRQ